MEAMLISTDVVEGHAILNEREENSVGTHSMTERHTSARADWAWKKTASLPRHLGPSQKKSLHLLEEQMSSSLDLQGRSVVRGNVGSEITSVTICVNSLEKIK